MLIQFVLLLLAAGLCGAIAQSLTGFSRGGCLTSIALGFIGAWLGAWLAGVLGVGEIMAIQIGGTSFPIVWSIVGASLFVAVLSLFTRRVVR